MQRQGRKGQAAAMRGEPNAVGIPKKWLPATSGDAWSHHEVRTAIEDAFKKLEAHLASGRDVVLPADGIGTGLAELPTRAPKLFARLEKWIAVLEARGNQLD